MLFLVLVYLLKYTILCHINLYLLVQNNKIVNFAFI